MEIAYFKDMTEQEAEAIRAILERYTSLRLPEPGKDHILYAFFKMGLDPQEAHDTLKDILREYRDKKSVIHGHDDPNKN